MARLGQRRVPDRPGHPRDRRPDPCGTATTVEAVRVLPATATGPTPVGGVQTGAGGTSHRGSHLLPLAAGLASVALGGFVTSRRRRRIG